METYSLACKNCGAPLIVAKTAREATCGHCGTRVGIKPTKDEPDIVILESPPQAKPPIQPRRVRPVRIEPVNKDYNPAEQRRQEREQEQIRLARHGANLLDAVTGYRSCLNGLVALVVVGGLLTCGLCGLPGILRWTAVNQNGAVRQAARSGKTDDMLKSAAGIILGRARVNQSLPTTEVGNSLINGYRDEWGRSPRYEQNSTSDFVLRSAGPDGVFDTPDDLTERAHASRVGSTSPADTQPMDLTLALERLQTPGNFRKDQALQWLIDQKPDFDETQRAIIVDAAIPLLRDRSLRSPAQTALTLWAQPGDAAKLSQAVEQAGPRDHDFIDTLVIQLIRLQDEEAVISLMNHSASSVRASVAVAINDWSVPDDRIVQQCMTDLDNPGRQEAAITRLNSMQLDQQQLTDATTRIKRLLIEEESSQVGIFSLDFLEKHAKVDTSLLIKIYDRTNDPFHRESELRERAGRELTQRPEPAVFLLFASQLGSRHSDAAERGVTYLKTMGSAAESYVWPSLRSEDRREGERACNLLAAIGTEKSLPHLQTVDVNGPNGSAAQAAILVIQNAQRRPANASPGSPATEP